MEGKPSGDDYSAKLWLVCCKKAATWMLRCVSSFDQRVSKNPDPPNNDVMPITKHSDFNFVSVIRSIKT